MTRLRRLLVIGAVAAALLVSTASAANAACRFIVDYSGNIVRVECDKIA